MYVCMCTRAYENRYKRMYVYSARMSESVCSMSSREGHFMTAVNVDIAMHDVTHQCNCDRPLLVQQGNVHRGIHPGGSVGRSRPRQYTARH